MPQLTERRSKYLIEIDQIMYKYSLIVQYITL